MVMTHDMHAMFVMILYTCKFVIKTKIKLIVLLRCKNIHNLFKKFSQKKVYEEQEIHTHAVWLACYSNILDRFMLLIF